MLEHVPKREQALVEIRRVVKDGGLLYLKPAWDCPWWFAQGYEVKPYSDFGPLGKLRKASLNLIASPYYRGASLIPGRYVRQMQARISGKPTRFQYRVLQPNYDQYWVADSDAVNQLDYFEMLLWFTSRGDECLNCVADPVWDVNELILRIHKKRKSRAGSRLEGNGVRSGVPLGSRDAPFAKNATGGLVTGSWRRFARWAS